MMRVVVARSSHGFSLIEMLATILIMAFVGAAITEICVTQNVVAFRTYNKIEALVNARRIASFIEQDVHNAIFVGDQLGVNQYQFPSGGPNNPYLTAGPSPSSNISQFVGFPASTSTTNWPLPPYNLDAQTLILQVPILASNPTPGTSPTDFFGIPTRNGLATGWNVDTYVYKVLADTSKPGLGQFVLQKAVFPGVNSSTSIGSNNPQTVLTGIVGPINPSDSPDPVAGVPLPKVFQFMTKQYPMSQGRPPQQVFVQPGSSQPDTTVVNGVAVALEVYSDAASKRRDLVPATLAFRSEMYLRGNYASPWSF